MKITLITCTYNAESVLQRTLDSVQKQTYADIEHLIIDGCSKDATMTMAQHYRDASETLHNGHAVVVRSEPDKGLYDAMNKGIRQATGDYLCFLNAGDQLASDTTIADIVASAEQESKVMSFSVLYGETDIVDDNGNFIRHRRLQAPKNLTWRSFKEGMLVCHQSFYANTSIAKATMYNLDYRLSADVDWCIRIMKKGSKVGMKTHNTHMVLCNYLDGGMSVQNHRASLIERFKVMANHYGLLPTILQHLWFVLRSLIKK